MLAYKMGNRVVSVLYCFILACLLVSGCQPIGWRTDGFEDSIWPIFRQHPNLINPSNDIPLPQSPINWSAGTPFLGFVTQAVLARNMPIEVALVPYLLSYYNNEARSTPWHRGLWQIKIDHCAPYGLICEQDYDERLHPILSTEAVLTRLSKLHEHHQNWIDAIDAYYQEQNLYTRHALPEFGSFLHALSVLKSRIQSPQETEFLPGIDPYSYFEKKSVPSKLNVIEIAHASSIDAELWQQLNAFFIDHKTSEQHHDILIPISAQENIKLPSHSSNNHPITDNINRLRYLLLYSDNRIKFRPPQALVPEHYETH